MKHCALSVLRNNNANANANSNNIIFTIKIISPCRNFVDNFLDKKYQNFSANDLKDLCIEMKTKSKNKNTTNQTSKGISLNQTL